MTQLMGPRMTRSIPETYIVCETRNYAGPDSISADREMWICSDKKMVKQTHISHCLYLSDERNVTVHEDHSRMYRESNVGPLPLADVGNPPIFG
jgi:hypothetical protein